MFEGLVMRNNHLEICRDLSSCFVELALWGEVERSAVTLQFERPYNQISHNQNNTTKCKQKWVTGFNNITLVMIQQSKANAQFLINI
jgi:hypothetical protein